MRIGVLTGGGDCPGLNAVIRALVRRGEQELGLEFIGIRHGWRGLVDDETMPLSVATTRGILHRGGTILGTSRTNPYKGEGDAISQVKATLERRGIDALVAIGGEDTLGVAHKLAADGVPAVGVPKTIDNDLSATDVTFGFDTAVQIAVDAIDRLHTTAESHDRVMVVEVMGRHAGWITSAVGMADDAKTPIPLVLLFPEIPFDEAAFLAAVDAKVAAHGYCCVGVSEGLSNAEGKLMAEAGTRDAFGHAQLGGVGPLIAGLVKEKLGHKYHWAVADYLQRAARHLASKTDVLQSYAVGRAAVEMALKGRNAVMPAITRVSDKPYKWKITEAPLAKVANVEKMLPRDFITRDGYGITAKARAYLGPLIRGEDPPPFRDGLPQYVRLKNVAVPKKLAVDFKV